MNLLRKYRMAFVAIVLIAVVTIVVFQLSGDEEFSPVSPGGPPQSAVMDDALAPAGE